MKTQNIAALLMEDCKTIGVRYKGEDKIYVFKTVESFEVGQYATVFTRQQFKTVKVMEVHKVPQLDMDSGLNYQWIVQKVDTTKYDELNSLEAEFNDHLLDLEQKAMRANAMELLTEKLGIKNKLLSSAIKKLNGIS